MRVYLCRHAHAAPGDPDELRELTEEGRRAARDLAGRLEREQPPPALVLTSPLLRARQTADAVAGALRVSSVVDARLAPGASAAALLEAASSHAVDAVAAVGHQPDLSTISVALTGADPGFPPGGMLALDLEP